MAAVNSGSAFGPSMDSNLVPLTSSAAKKSTSVPADGANAKLPRLHRIRTVRMQQGMSLRTIARHTGLDVRTLRAQEVETSDLRLSDVYRWQRVLEVPASELLLEHESPLSRPVLERAKLVRIMKTVLLLQEQVHQPRQKRLVQTLVVQLINLMPELAHVTAWPTYGQRRSLDELGRVAEQVIPEDWFTQRHWDEE